MDNYALYIHIPWCKHKCPYCDFNAHGAHGEIDEAQYIERVCADLEADLTTYPFLRERTVSSIYIGGGTPNMLSASGIAHLVEQVLSRIPLHHAKLEITIELNPDFYRIGDFTRYAACGINRVSLGIQTLDDALLQLLERTHSTNQSRRMLDDALAVFSKVNVDLMFGIAGQTPAQALGDLHTLLTQGIQHISWYQLTVEPNSKLYSRAPLLASDDTVHAIIEQGERLLTESAFYHYEISAFATSAAHQSQHNTHYWQFGDYLGIGAGACGKITDEQGRVWRTHKTRHPKDYLQDRLVTQLVSVEQVVTEQLPFEFLLNGLRLADGFAWHTFTQCTGYSSQWLHEQLNSFVQRKMLVVDDAGVRPTRLGWHGLDSILAACM